MLQGKTYFMPDRLTKLVNATRQDIFHAGGDTGSVLPGEKETCLLPGEVESDDGLVCGDEATPHKGGVHPLSHAEQPVQDQQDEACVQPPSSRGRSSVFLLCLPIFTWLLPQVRKPVLEEVGATFCSHVDEVVDI